MTPKERAAMQQALEALEAVSTAKERGFGIEYAKGYVDPVITALREALAGDNMSPTEQAEQEPVAVGKVNDQACIDWFEGITDYEAPVGATLYAAPVRTKDLTDDEIYPLYNEPTSDKEAIEFARAVIAADREKNK